MNISHSETESKGAFRIMDDGESEALAELTYSKAGKELIILDHTEVSDKLRGKGAGEKLVRAAVDLAREKKVKIMPLCPFANAMFKKHEELRDVL